MPDNPIHTSFQLPGETSQTSLSLGGYRWFEVVLHWALLIGSVTVAFANWRLDDTQRTGTHISIYAMQRFCAFGSRGMRRLWSGTCCRLLLSGGGGALTATPSIAHISRIKGVLPGPTSLAAEGRDNAIPRPLPQPSPTLPRSPWRRRSAFYSTHRTRAARA